MNNKVLTALIIGLAVGGLVGVGSTKVYMSQHSKVVSNDSTSMMTPAPGHENTPEMQVGSTDMTGQMYGATTEMTAELQTKTGDDFDKAFIVGMIYHHQGAIDMANVALKNAGHQEIKDLAKNIITAQTTEIAQMKQWQQAWFK